MIPALLWPVAWTSFLYQETVNIHDEYELMSFDVVSLFTNVPVELALSVVEKRLDEVDVSSPLSPSRRWCHY